MCKEDIPDPSLPGGVPGDNQPVDGGVTECVDAHLHVRVVDATDGSTPIVGADVVVDGRGSKSTDAQGWAKWRPIPPGTYRVQARKDLHSLDPVVDAAVVVPACTLKEITLQLQPVDLHLHVDADRDGAVDADWSHNTPWTPGAGQFGAVVLFNNDNDDRDPGKVRDFENDNVDGASDLGDLAPLHLRRHPPGAPLPPTVTAVLSLSAGDKLRIVHPASAAGTEIVGPAHASHTFDNAALQASTDIALAMEGLQYPDAAFDGKLNVVLQVQVNGATVRTERAEVRVAPWMVFNHAMLTEKAYIMNTGDNGPLITSINAVLGGAGVPALQQAAAATYSGDRWMQDGMEPGFAAMPRAGGGDPVTPATLRTAMHRGASMIDTYPKAELLDRDYGFLQALPPGGGTSLDSFGNLECSPPFTHSGAGGELARHYPFGRAIFGGDTQGNGAPTRQMHPRVQALLRAQVVQAPIEIDSNWLVVGHVDEFISFLPGAGGTHGWKVLIASPQVATTIVAAQPAATPLFRGINMAQTDPFADPPAPVGAHYPLRTCGAIVGDPTFQSWQVEAQAIIDHVRTSELMPKLDLRDSDFIHLPVLFDKRGSRFIAYTAGSVNMLVVTKGGSNNHLCIPKPFGPHPAVGGCRFEADIRTKLAPHATAMRFIDDFFTYHVGQGEIHCGTNSQRTPPTDKWWDLPWI